MFLAPVTFERVAESAAGCDLDAQMHGDQLRVACTAAGARELQETLEAVGARATDCSIGGRPERTAQPCPGLLFFHVESDGRVRRT